MRQMHIIRALGVLVLLFPAGLVQAAITCTVSSPGVSTLYNTADVAATVVQSSATVTCQRNLAGDAASQAYSIGADNGLYSTAGKPRAALAANYVTYDTYSDSACATLWKKLPAGSARIPVGGGTLALGGVGVPASATTNFWVCIPAAQAGVTAGAHTDTITMTLYDGTSNTALTTGALSVAIYADSTCSITTQPGTISMTYTSFGGLVSGNTTFAPTCTSGLPYTMALDATSGTLLGLNYTLALSATAATGTGTPQTYTITGGIAGGQSGTCAGASCTASATHTVTISY